MGIPLFQDVMLKCDLPQHGLLAGEIGTIMDRHETDGAKVGYSVEFFDAVGRTRAVVTVGEADLRPLSHFTREPWWIVPLSGVASALMPLIYFWKFKQKVPGTSVPMGMVIMGGLGLVASTILVMRSRVRSLFWSNVLLWGGILLAALGVCVAYLLLTA